MLATSCTAVVAIHNATGLPVVVAPRERDLLELAAYLRRQHPENPLLIAAPANNRAAVSPACLIGGQATTPEAVIAEAPQRLDAIRAATRRISEAVSAGEKVAGAGVAVPVSREMAVYNAYRRRTLWRHA